MPCTCVPVCPGQTSTSFVWIRTIFSRTILRPNAKVTNVINVCSVFFVLIFKLSNMLNFRGNNALRDTEKQMRSIYIVWCDLLISNLRISYQDHVTTALRHLRWLHVQYRIFYKLCLLMHLVHFHKAPLIADIVTLRPTASVSSHGRLQSASSSRYEQPRMRLEFGKRCFSYAAPAAWNTLPPSLQQLTNTDSFKRQLKLSLNEPFLGLDY